MVIDAPAVIHLVPHTHWDREWYEPFQVFRMRLVELVDQLLDSMEADDRLAFTLDGQVATIDDYLEVRPEGRAADRAAHRRRPACDRSLADPHGRVPRLGRDDDPEPGDRLARGRGLRRGDAGRLPAGHVRAHRPDAPDPPPCGDPARRRVARRAAGDRSPCVHLARPGWLLRSGGIPRRRLRQRRLPAGHPGSSCREGRSLRGSRPGVLRRPLDPRDVRHRPRGPLPQPRPGRGRGERDPRRHRRPDRDPERLHPRVRCLGRGPGPARSSGRARLDRESSDRRPGRTC